jgi:hypothetical protein
MLHMIRIWQCLRGLSSYSEGSYCGRLTFSMPAIGLQELGNSIPHFQRIEIGRFY